MLISGDEFVDVVQFAEKDFLCWLKAFSSKKSNLIMDRLGDVPLTVMASLMGLLEKIIASITKVQKAVCDKIVETRDSSS